MRRLSQPFIDSLAHGLLAPLRLEVVRDKDLNLEIRDDYLNIYFKGNSLLRLAPGPGDGAYRPHVDPQFLLEAGLQDFRDEASVAGFVEQIPNIKKRINAVARTSLETEYEQLIIRANNREARNASEYFIVDRQYATGRERFDLTGFFWPHAGRRSGQEVAPCILEVKFALNEDIGAVHEQLERYYRAVEPRAAEFAEECETIFHCATRAIRAMSAINARGSICSTTT